MTLMKLLIQILFSQGFQGSSAHLLLWTFSLCIHCKTNNNKSSRIWCHFFVDYKILWKSNLLQGPGVMWGPTQNLGPIGSADLTFTGYKQTKNQTEGKQSIYIYKFKVYLKAFTGYFLWVYTIQVYRFSTYL